MGIRASLVHEAIVFSKEINSEIWWNRINLELHVTGLALCFSLEFVGLICVHLSERVRNPVHDGIEC